MSLKLSIKDARRLLGDKTNTPWHKYGAETRASELTVDGFKFDSLAEMRRYGELKLLHLTGLIADSPIVHPRYPIFINKTAVCYVELDFSYWDNFGKLHYEDVKGKDLPMSRLKRKMFEAFYGQKVELVRMSGKRAFR